ncbi:MAG TPA: amino acid permease [Gemmatimonadaceae bacterium]|jgi:APA family basic amino acid/polyamine antiporter|nr:amino acid permease [Gemmatimonadaceae bacterium]
MREQTSRAPVLGDRDFVKALTLTDATMLVAGSMIGSGIFIVSSDIARTVGTPFWLMTAWVITGVMTLLGALTYGELAGMFPKAGGQYVFLRESMGPLMGFLYGWTLLVVIQTGTIAAVAVAFGRFLGVLWPAVTPELYSWFPRHTFVTPGGTIEVGLSAQRVVALVMVWLLTWINLRGIREGKLVQTTLTIVKTGALALLIVLGLTVGRNATALTANFAPGNFAPHVDITSMFVLGFGTALVGSLFSSDAWNNVTFAAAEVQNPRRNLPLSLALGTGLVTVLYLLANLAYLNVLPLIGSAHGAAVLARGIQFATQDRVGVAAAEIIFGPIGVTLVAAAILVSTFGCNNGLILAGARVSYAMSLDRLFFKRAGTLNRHDVPAFALVVQAIWTSFLCLTGTYGQLLDYVIFAALVFYVATTLGLFVLRVKRPNAERPYRAFGYPVLPALYMAMAAAVAVALVVADKTRTQAMSGLVIVLIGVPIYFLWRGAAGDTARQAV